MNPIKVRCLATVFAMGALATASHALLVDPTGSNFLVAGDDSVASYAPGGNFAFYGGSYGSVGVVTNGYLVTSGTQTYNGWTNAAFPTTAGTSGTANIAPLWDDLYSDGSGQTTYGIFTKGTTNWDAITWDEQTFAQQTTGHVKMQAVLIRNNVTLSGFNFLAGDIAFSYDVLDGGGTALTATSGVNAGDGANFTLSPGTVNGTESGANLPIFTTAGQFVLFRWTGNAYTGSIQAVPEPASMAVLGAGALALLRRRRKA